MASVTKLTIASIDLLDRFAAQHCVHGEFDADLFGWTVRKQFPNLKHILLLAYVPEQHQAFEKVVFEALMDHFPVDQLSIRLDFKVTEYESILHY